MTVIIRVDNTLIADRASVVDSWVTERSKVHERASMIWGSAGMFDTQGVIEAQNLHQMASAIERNIEAYDEARQAWLVIERNGRPWQLFVRNKELVVQQAANGVAIGRYRGEWAAWQNDEGCSVVSAQEFCRHVSALWRLEPVAHWLSVEPEDFTALRSAEGRLRSTDK